MKTHYYRLPKTKEVQLTDPFFTGYRELVKKVVIPYQHDILMDQIPDTPPSHAIRNFRIAAGEEQGNFYGEIFQDSDLYKWLEAVGNALRIYPDEKLEEEADKMIALIARAQQDNGYLNTYFMIEEPEKKWSNILECHELYCAGHLVEAAVSYYEATGKEALLKVACRFADHIDNVFGVEDGKLHGYPGHQEIELALLRLYDATGEERYFTLAAYFIDTRGTNQFFEEEFVKREQICHWTQAKLNEPNRWYNQFPYSYYNQFHLPVREQEAAVGHAVRGVYMYTAMADIAARTQEQNLIEACEKIWNDIVEKQMYITGGIGATHSGEAFTTAFDLPNDTNYAETCASIGLIFFAQKMLAIEPDGVYADVIEKALYNTVLSGLSLDGKRFFYVNPLEVIPETCAGNTERNHVKPVRQKWFACACCPPNIARLLTSLEKYLYTYRENAVYIHLYLGFTAEIPLSDGTVFIEQKGNYPWSGTISIAVNPLERKEKSFTVALRLPGWCINPLLKINEEGLKDAVIQNGYVMITREWHATDIITLELTMQPMLMSANQRIHYNAGRRAIQRGPLIYCIEEYDNGKYLNQMSIAKDPHFSETNLTDDLKKGVAITADAVRERLNTEQLYEDSEPEKENVILKAVPYFMWNNRGAGEMQVWIRKM